MHPEYPVMFIVQQDIKNAIQTLKITTISGLKKKCLYFKEMNRGVGLGGVVF